LKLAVNHVYRRIGDKAKTQGVMYENENSIFSDGRARPDAAQSTHGKWAG
jgi:hypothetical protein